MFVRKVALADTVGKIHATARQHITFVIQIQSQFCA